MRVYFDSYKTIMQNESGGIPMRMKKFITHINRNDVCISLFDQWNNKVSDCDILHIFKANIESYNLALYAKSCGKKVVVSSVVPIDNKYKIRLSLQLYKCIPVLNTYVIYQNLLMLADAVIAQTKKEADFISANFGVAYDRLHVIPNGVDEAILECCDNVTELEKDIVLYVGRFDSNKNQLAVIRAMKGTDIPVYFVGGSIPTERGYYERCINEASGSDQFHFVGWLDHESDTLLQLYKRAKVAALLSHKEIFGNSLIEGAACGANLVATEALPIEEWGFGSHCVKVNPKSEKHIRQAIVQMYKTPISMQIQQIVRSRFSWNAVVTTHISLYEALLFGGTSK